MNSLDVNLQFWSNGANKAGKLQEGGSGLAIMRDKRLPVLLAVIVALIAMWVIPLAGCAGEVSVTTAALSEATMCKSIDPATRQPLEKGDIFPPETETLYCSVKLSNAPRGTELKAQLIYLQVEAAESKSVLLLEESITTAGTSYVAFTLTREAQTPAWPMGEYIVKLFLNGKEEVTVPFLVTTAFLSEATMCQSVDPETMQPLEKGAVFSPDTETLYCSVKISNAPTGTELKAQLIYLQVEAAELNNVVLLETSVTTTGTRNIGFAFTLQPQTPAWPVGEYIVKLFIDNKEQTSVPFRVQ